MSMFNKMKDKVTTVSKETIKEEVKKHMPEILTGASVLMLAYLCVKIGTKGINVTVNVNTPQLY